MRYLYNFLDSGVNWYLSFFISIDQLNFLFNMICDIINLDNSLDLYDLLFDKLNNLGLSICYSNFNDFLLNDRHLNWNFLITYNRYNFFDYFFNYFIDFNYLWNNCLQFNNLNFFNEFFNNYFNWNNSWDLNSLLNDLLNDLLNNLNRIYSFSYNNRFLYICRYFNYFFIDNNLGLSINLRYGYFYEFLNISLDLYDLCLSCVDRDWFFNNFNSID